MLKLPCVLLAGLIFLSCAGAQEMPSRRLEAPAVPTLTLRAPQLRPAVVDALVPAQEKRATLTLATPGPMRVGTVRGVNAEKRATVWRALPEGGFVTQLVARSSGAQGIRARIEISAARAGMDFRVVSAAGGVVEAGLSSLKGDVWTPYTEGDTQVIELYSASDPGAAELRVAEIVHFDISPLSVQTKASGACNPDVACTTNDPVLDSAINERKNSVALINFVQGGSSFICSGTLINSGLFPAPFLLTANHCISTQSAASSITAYWFRQNTTCGGSTLDPSAQQVGGGASLVFTNYNVDSTLLHLNNMPPRGVVYSAWNAAPVAADSSIVSLSHPKGDPTKYALGTMSKLIRPSDWPQDMYGITFTTGVIEGGSSGSGLFTLSGGSLQLRGILTGTTDESGGLSCTNLNEFGLYGRLEIFYPEIQYLLNGTVAPPDDYPNTIASAPDLPLGGSKSGKIDYAGDIDVFRVTVTQPGNLSVYSSGGNDLVGTLLNSVGTALIANDDAETRNNEFGFTYQVEQGVYYVAVAHWMPDGVATYQVHADFSTVTDNYSDIWYTPSEGGWGISLTHQGNNIAGALYTYDLDGSSMWLLMAGGARQADGSYLADLLRYTGPAFNASPWPVQSVSSTKVGTMRILFTGHSNAQLTYTVNGVSVSKAISRFVYDKQPTCGFSIFDRSYTFNFQDIWWTSPESGWGLNLAHQGDVVAGALYTYDQAGKSLWLLMAGNSTRTLTSTSVVYTSDLLRYTGPPFNASPWPATSASTKVGTMSVAFTTGNQGTLTYTVNGVQVVKSINRFVFSSPMTACE
jgi:lysyl endopeptidase